jgi:rSAM-associated Gly-rich repeat protein
MYMAAWNLTRRALSFLLPAGVLGASVLLASVQATPVSPPSKISAAGDTKQDVAARLASIRKEAGLASTRELAAKNVDKYPLLAYWLNIGGLGWRNGGWRNFGGWHNWGNGWHNWGNGWHNWGNGWHNYWHNW